MVSRGSGSDGTGSTIGVALRRAFVVLVVGTLVLSGAGAGLGALAPPDGTHDRADGTVASATEGAATASSASAEAYAARTQAQQHRQAAREGVEEGVELARQEGTNVSEAQIEAAREGALNAVRQTIESRTANEGSPAQVRRAVRGAVHGVLLGNESATPEEIRWVVEGSAHGALTQARGTPVGLQASAYGAAHGSIARSDRASGRQMRKVALGAAAGGVKGEVRYDVIAAEKLKQAAQGGAYGALERPNAANVEKLKGAARGAAQGVLKHHRGADVKQIQLAAMGGASGSLVGGRQSTAPKVEAASRGGAACGASVTQTQHVSLEQVQVASGAAASGAVSQSQSAEIVQIQSAAEGACAGVLEEVTQIQTVEVTQIQIIVRESASTATAQAVQENEQRSNVIFVNARSAGRDRVVAENDADRDGLTDRQEERIGTNPERADSDGDGLSDGAEVLTFDTAPTDADTDDDGLEDGRELQLGTDPTAADTDGDGIEDGQEVADGADPLDPNDPEERDGDDDGLTDARENELGTDPDDPDTDDNGIADGREVRQGSDPLDPDDPPEIEDLTVTTECEQLTVSNPNVVPVEVTVEGDTEAPLLELRPFGQATLDVSPGEYTLTAETDGETVQLDGEDALDVEVADCPVDVDADVVGSDLTFTNPADVGVTATVAGETTGEETVEVEPGASASLTGLASDNYTVTAETTEGDEALVDGDEVWSFAVTETNVTGNVTGNVTDNVTDGNVTENVTDTNVTDTNVTDNETDENVTDGEENVTADEEWPPDATEIEVGETVTREPLGNETDDWYAVELEADETVKIVHGQSGRDAAIALHGPDGTQLESDTITTDTRSFGTTVNESGTYFVNVRGDGTYSFTVLAPGPDENEPNDDAGNATAIEPAAPDEPTGPDDGIAATVAGDEADWFAVEAETGQRIVATLTREDVEVHVGNDLEVAILAPNGSEFGRFPAEYCPGPDEPTTRTVVDPGCERRTTVNQTAVAPVDGTYYVRVSGLEHEDGTDSVAGYSNYSLTVTASEPLFDRVAPPQNATFEPGTQVLFEVREGEGADASPAFESYRDGVFDDAAIGPLRDGTYDDRAFVRGTLTETSPETVVGRVADRETGELFGNVRWNVSVAADGDAAPEGERVAPTTGTVELAEDESTELTVSASDPDGDLDRVLLVSADCGGVLETAAVSGTTDTATFEYAADPANGTCDVGAWVVDEQGAMAEVDAWTVTTAEAAGVGATPAPEATPTPNETAEDGNTTGGSMAGPGTMDTAGMLLVAGALAVAPLRRRLW